MTAHAVKPGCGVAVAGAPGCDAAMSGQKPVVAAVRVATVRGQREEELDVTPQRRPLPVITPEEFRPCTAAGYAGAADRETRHDNPAVIAAIYVSPLIACSNSLTMTSTAASGGTDFAEQGPET